MRPNIFGLNATVPYKISTAEVQRHTQGDALHARKENYRNDRNPHFATYGPKTRRQFFNLLRRNRGERT